MHLLPIMIMLIEGDPRSEMQEAHKRGRMIGFEIMTTVLFGADLPDCAIGVLHLGIIPLRKNNLLAVYFHQEFNQ